MAKKYLHLGNILKRLLFDKDMKPVDLAREVNIPPPTIHRLVTGKSTRPYKSSLKPIADYFSLTVDQLIGEEPLEPATSSPTNLTTFREIPLIPWNEMEGDVKNKYEKIPFVGKISEVGFATILPDFSMEPMFTAGSVLIFDPKKPCKDRSFILVKLNEINMVVFRQLLIDLEHKYLKPLNPDLNVFKMRMLGDKDEILATLIEARQIFQDH